MLSLITIPEAQKMLAENLRNRRLDMELTQANLAERSGVALPTLRKFEQTGEVSLKSFLKLLMIVGGTEELIEATRITPRAFANIDEVLRISGSVRRRLIQHRIENRIESRNSLFPTVQTDSNRNRRRCRRK